MDSEQRALFRHAREFEGDLNERQRAILARLARGETNAQIADAYGMTFDGAKWNVSEILSKLGLSSREEAADYWRWRQSPKTRVSEMVRALVPAAMPAKLATGAAGIAVVGVAVFVAIVLATRDDGEPQQLTATPPFMLTANVVVTGSPMGETRSTVAWRWQDQRHFAYELFVADPMDGPHTYTVVANGHELWTDDSTAPTYSRGELPPVIDDVPPALPISALIGPAPERSMDELLRYLTRRPGETDPDNPPFARIAGEEKVLGVTTTIVEYGPAWMSSSTQNGPIGTTPAAASIESGGIIRLWVDPETMFILRNEMEGLDQSSEVEVTSIEYHPQFAVGAFAFTPSPGKTEERE